MAFFLEYWQGIFVESKPARKAEDEEKTSLKDQRFSIIPVFVLSAGVESLMNPCIVRGQN